MAPAPTLDSLQLLILQLPGDQCPIQDFTGIAHMHICTLRYTIKINLLKWCRRNKVCRTSAACTHSDYPYKRNSTFSHFRTHAAPHNGYLQHSNVSSPAYKQSKQVQWMERHFLTATIFKHIYLYI